MRARSSLERLFVDPAAPVDGEPNPETLRCLFCSKRFRFGDQVMAHLWSKHRDQLVFEIVDLRREVKEARDAAVTLRTILRERSGKNFANVVDDGD